MLPNKKSIARLFLASTMLVLLGACAGMSSTPSPAQQAAADHASEQYRQGHFEAAARDWQALAAQNHPQRGHYLLQAAESYRQLGNWDQATPLLNQIDRNRIDVHDVRVYDLLMAESALAHDHAEQAISLTANAATLPAGLRPRGLELRARALAAAGQPVAAARTRLELDQSLQGYDREQNRKQLLNLLESTSNAHLNDAANQLPDTDPMRAWIAQALKNKGSALASSLPQLQRPVGTLLLQPGTEAAPEGYRPVDRIALLLPASGPLQQAANAVHDGFFEALQNKQKHGPVTQVQTYDSGGTAQTALDAYRQAVDDGAQLVVGPLLPDAVSTLFQKTQLPVRILALNYPAQGLPPDGNAEFALPPEAEGAQVAAHMASLNLHQAVLFLADADWAQRAARAFRAQFESLGGQILGSASLSPDEVNYATAINAITADTGPNTGVFIAMRPEQGRLLVPQLRIVRIQQPLFSTSHIYAAQSNPGLDRDLDGVIFCDQPWLFEAQPSLPRQDELAKANPAASGPAARLYAFGMDAFALTPYLDWLHDHPGSYLSGATGQLTMDSFGRVQRTPIWAQFVNGVAVPISGGLNTDDSMP